MSENGEDLTLADEVRALREQMDQLERGRRRGQFKVFAAALLACALGVVGTSTAQDLATFTANTPARAADVNANFALLKQWIERKVGDVDVGCTDANCAVDVSGDLDASGTVTGSTVRSTGNIAIDGNDFIFGTNARGDGGRAIVRQTGDLLVLNYASDFAGGTQVQGNLEAQNDLAVRGSTTVDSLLAQDASVLGDFRVGGSTIRDIARDYVRSSCRVQLGWTDGCNSTCTVSPGREGPNAHADGTCSGGDGAKTRCNNNWAALNVDGDVNGDDNFYIRFICD